MTRYGYPETDRDIAGELEDLRDATGLEWSRIGRMLGADRAAVTSWRAGKPMTDEELAVLDGLKEIAADAPTDRRETRAWLNHPGEDGTVPYRRMLRVRHRVCA